MAGSLLSLGSKILVWTFPFTESRLEQSYFAWNFSFFFFFLPREAELSYWCQLGQRRDRKGRGEAEEAEGRQGSIQRRCTGLKSD